MVYAVQYTDLSGVQRYVLTCAPDPFGVEVYASKAEAETEAGKWPSVYAPRVVPFPVPSTE